MQIKRFEAKDVQEALRQVRAVMGPDALIFSTRTVKRSPDPRGFCPPPMIEVVAATDRQEPVPTAPEAAPNPACVPPRMRQNDRPEGDRVIQKVLSTGLHPEFVYSLLEEVERIRKGVEGLDLLELFRGYLRWKLMEAVDVTGPATDGPKIWAFVGPTGVGKTTTLAKLAAHFKLRVTQKITLITLDHYRIGAIEQLKMYAQILRLPLRTALHPQELKEIIEENVGQDLLLIDTVGRSPHDVSGLAELREFLTVHPQIESHLVLSAATKEKDLDQIVHRFSVLPVRNYIFTKIDETEEYIPLFNQLLRHKRPLSYLTNGQRVPEDIELATKVKMANLVLNTMAWN
jgi:flagellar biosynthesis protein FlhF